VKTFTRRLQTTMSSQLRPIAYALETGTIYQLLLIFGSGNGSPVATNVVLLVIGVSKY